MPIDADGSIEQATTTEARPAATTEPAVTDAETSTEVRGQTTPTAAETSTEVRGQTTPNNPAGDNEVTTATGPVDSTTPTSSTGAVSLAGDDGGDGDMEKSPSPSSSGYKILQRKYCLDLLHTVLSNCTDWWTVHQGFATFRSTE